MWRLRLRRLRRRQWGRRRRTRRWWRRWWREGVRGARRINLRAEIKQSQPPRAGMEQGTGGEAAGGKQTSRARTRACAACPQGDARQTSSRGNSACRQGGGRAHRHTWASSGGERCGPRGCAHPEEVSTRWSRLTFAASSPCPQTALLHWTYLRSADQQEGRASATGSALASKRSGNWRAMLIRRERARVWECAAATSAQEAPPGRHWPDWHPLNEPFQIV